MSESKVLILTGASKGIGLAIARYLLRHAHKVVVVARSKGPLDDLKTQYPQQVEVLAGDLSDFSLGDKAHDLARSSWGRLDSLILNHGVLEPIQRIGSADVQQFRNAFDVNFFSYVAMVKACLPSLREAKGRIIMCSSGAATGAYSTWGAYGATKAAVNHLAKTLQVEEPDVTTISVRPGVVDTDMQRSIREQHATSMDKHAAAKFMDLKSSGGLLKPEQPGHVMAKLALEAPAELSGEFITWNDDRLKEFQES